MGAVVRLVSKAIGWEGHGLPRTTAVSRESQCERAAQKRPGGLQDGLMRHRRRDDGVQK